MRLISALLDLLFPPKCIFCRRLLQEEETALCSDCAAEALEMEVEDTHGEFFTQCISVFPYAGAVAASIKRYKFHGAAHYGAVYGALLAARIQTRLQGSFDTITWVPVSGRRRRNRGYDQAELLCRAVAGSLGRKPERLLRKMMDNPAQARSGGPAQRRANVLGVYMLARGANVKGRRILLIDDIVTTGATLSECSRVLLTAGAREVVCATFAATPVMELKKNDVQTDQ